MKVHANLIYICFVAMFLIPGFLVVCFLTLSTPLYITLLKSIKYICDWLKIKRSIFGPGFILEIEILCIICSTIFWLWILI